MPKIWTWIQGRAKSVFAWTRRDSDLYAPGLGFDLPA